MAIALFILTATGAAELKDNSVDGVHGARTLLNASNISWPGMDTAPLSKALQYDREDLRAALKENYSWPHAGKGVSLLLHPDALLGPDTVNTKVLLNASNCSNPLSEPIHMAKNRFWLAGFNRTSSNFTTLNVTGYEATLRFTRERTALKSDEAPKRSGQANVSLTLKIVHPGESIQAAIEAASPGYTIEVQSGSYGENVRVNKRLTVRGVDVGGGLPVIDACGKGDAIKIASDGVVLEKLNVTNATTSETAGIRLKSSNHCLVRGVRAYHNYYGINLVDCRNDSVSKCILGRNDQGIRLYNSNQIKILNSDLNDNKINGIVISSSNDNLIAVNNISGNACGIYLDASKGNSIINNSLANNHRSLGGDFAEADNQFINNTIPSAEASDAKEVTTYAPGLKGIVEDVATVPPPTPPRPSSEDGGDGYGPDIGSLQKSYISSTEKLQKVIDEEVERLSWGKITFTPPKEMYRGVRYPVVARISRDLFANMTEGLEEFDEVKTERIKVSYEMTVELGGGSYFQIDPKTQEPKTMPKSGFVEWTWEVVPLVRGTHVLKLVALATINLTNGERRVQTRVYEEDIVVDVDQIRELQAFFLSGGRWAISLFVTTLIGGLIALCCTGIIGRIKARFRGAQGDGAQKQEEKES